MKRFSVGALGSTVLALCAIGCLEEEDCTLTLEEWCGEEGCAARPDLDEALEQAREASGSLNSAQHCGDRVIVTLSGGFTGVSFVYDAESGELVGGASFSDALTDDACENQKMAAGESTVCLDTACNLLGNRTNAGGFETEACHGDLAEPFIEACLAAPPPAIEGCKACACMSCYPSLLTLGGLGPDLLPAAVDCLKEHCPGECGAPIDGVQ
jgi:hypothetical protein